MQKLYKVAFQRILAKVGADKADNLTLESLQNLLTEKNIPLNEIDQTLFHKIPREELKNLMRNPCPITKPGQTSTEAVTAAKAVRGALSIVEKRICFKCPFVGTCDKAFLEPSSDFKIQNPLQNLLITMKNATQLQNSEIYKPRSWFSGVRICDSMNSVLDDLMQGGEDFKIFKQERMTIIDEMEANEKLGKTDEKQLIKQAKKQKVPLKDVYAQIPSSNKAQANADKQGEEAFEQLSKGPENIFKKKKSDQFIKIAKKYLNEQKVQNDKNVQEQRKQKREERKSYKKSYEQNENQQQPQTQRGGNRRQMRGQQRGGDRRQMRGQQRGERYSKGKYTNNRQQPGNYRQQRFQKQQYNNKRFDNNREKSRNFRDQNNQNDNDRYQSRRNDRNGGQQTRNYDNQRGYQQNYRQRDYNQDEGANPRIRRFSKDNQGQYRNNQQVKEETGAPKRGNKIEKFFTEMKQKKSDQEEILANFNRKESQRETSRLPRDARQRPQGGRSSSMEFNEKEMREFDRLEKVPKILKTQFASKQDIQQRQQQQFSSEETQGERKGRRIRRT